MVSLSHCKQRHSIGATSLASPGRRPRAEGVRRRRARHAAAPARRRTWYGGSSGHQRDVLSSHCGCGHDPGANFSIARSPARVPIVKQSHLDGPRSTTEWRSATRCRFQSPRDRRALCVECQRRRRYLSV